MSEIVNVENFVRAETARIFDGLLAQAGAPDGEGLKNHLYVMDGWNYAFRRYQPHPSVLDGSWMLPDLTAQQ